MRASQAIAGAATVAGALAVPASQIAKRSDAFKFTGVSSSGAEFGSANLPGVLGTDYVWPSTSSLDTLVGTGMNTIRVPFMMERLVPDTLTGEFDEAYAKDLDSAVEHITGKGAYAILDPHNFGRYYSNVITDVSGFGSWWAKVAERYKDNKLVVFDTNNEYHDMDNSLVAQLNQAAIDAIRGAGATSQYIFVEGNSWSGAWTWVSSGNGDALSSLTDASDKLVYEMHQYLDSDGSGTSEACVSATIGRERLQAATAWLRDNGKTAVLGETAGGANEQCISALVDMLSFMQDNADVWTGWLWWAAGPWWADYMYSLEPPTGTAYTEILPSIKQFI